jgi:hypothetical protein
MDKLKELSDVQLNPTLFFKHLPENSHYYWNLKSDGYYGSAFKLGIEKQILHSSIFKLINECHNVDFVFIQK